MSEAGSGVGYRTVNEVVLRQEVVGEVVLKDQGVVTWLRVGPPAGGVVLPARAEGLRIEETGEVPTLRVVNPTDLMVLLAGNQVVRGGKQTRTVERTVIVGPRAAVRVPVRCVEKGRWSFRGNATSNFEVDEKLSLKMRTELTRTRTCAAATGAAYSSPQAEVWSEVDAELARTGTDSPTALYAAYTSSVRKAQVEEAQRRVALRPPAGANAVLVQPRPGGFWFEVFPNAEALAAQAPGVLADLFEQAPGTRGAVRPSAEVLAAVWGSPLRPIGGIEGALGESFAVVGGARGEITVVGGAVAHMAVCDA